MCVATRSRNQRSWLITTAHPAKLSSASSSARSVSTSRSLVGSSSSSRLLPFLSSLARWTRLRSPPDSVPTLRCCPAPLKLNHDTYARDATFFLPSSISSLPPDISSQTVLLPSSASRLWSTYPICTVSPILSAPASGFSCPVIIRSSVVLP